MKNYASAIGIDIGRYSLKIERADMGQVGSLLGVTYWGLNRLAGNSI